MVRRKPNPVPLQPKQRTLVDLPLGAHFRIVGNGWEGVVLFTNGCRVGVRFDNPSWRDDFLAPATEVDWIPGTSDRVVVDGQVYAFKGTQPGDFQKLCRRLAGREVFRF
jgi:hypothetical protein